NLKNYSMEDLLGGKELEIVAAALLLTGKLKVDAVQVFRNSPVVSIILLGQYETTKDRKTNDLIDFMKKNGDMTLEEVTNAFYAVNRQKG
ncbi:hypothetical protein, partial [Virgibacillus sp. DJP39]|uniref:hypothetical protein n=1 Tax=Virgibacillus sp. DJP39 TaxID=3409790 RepID=UPI003BB5D609